MYQFKAGSQRLFRISWSPRFPTTHPLASSLRYSGYCLIFALLAGCEAFSWGDDTHGQLGDGIIGGGRVTPGAAAAGAKWVALRAGQSHTCGIKPGGSLWCWGVNNAGQLGNGIEDVDSAVPVQVGTATDWSQVAPGLFHTCGIRASGQLWCWGAGSSGELGDGLSTKSLVPVRVGLATDWKEITTGPRFSCGIRGAGDLYCWGRNDYGQLGVGDYTNRATPTPLTGSPWKKVDAGLFHACAISVMDIGYCWGRNEEEQVLFGSPAATLPSPVAIYGVSLFTVHEIRAGYAATCLRIKGSIASGEDSENVVNCVGEASPILQGSPTSSFVGCDGCATLEDLPRFRQIDLGDGHACGILEGSNEALCWGAGTDGQLGQGASSDSVLPVTVLGNKQWESISTGSDHTVGLEIPPNLN